MSTIAPGPSVPLTNPARRQKIIDVAAEAFLRHGFESVSMDQIAYAANVGKMTLYRHFGSKSELFRTVVEQMSERIAPILKSSLDKSIEMEDALYSYADNYITVSLDERTTSFARILIPQANTNLELAKICIGVFFEDFLAPLEDYISYKMASGELREDDPKFIAQYYMNSIVNTTNVLVNPLLDREALRSENNLRAIVRLFLRSAAA